MKIAAPVQTGAVIRLPHCPTHRSGIRNQSSELISPQNRFALLLEML
jgi:hypothetical protein